ncbi:MAG: ribonuclease HI family protein [Bacteroidota bacterium]|jgi:ribonuclease HI
MTVYAYTDGASRGNPGESGIGILLKDDAGNVLYSGSDYIGKATNNKAEYRALIACLNKAKETGCKKLVVHSDSELMVRQIQGTYKVRNKDLRQFVDEVRRLLKDASFEFSIVQVSREENRDADLLANAGIDSALANRR